MPLRHRGLRGFTRIPPPPDLSFRSSLGAKEDGGGILRSRVNIAIMRAFVRLRETLASHKDLARKLEELEKKYDEQFRVVFEAIKQLMTPEEPERKGRIGFRLE